MEGSLFKATARGLSRFEEALPLLLRLGLLILFCWNLFDVWVSNVSGEVRFFLTVLGVLFLLPLAVILVSTYRKFDSEKEAEPTPKMPSLWPFIIVNLLVILLVAAIAKAEDTKGLLFFTQRWVERIGTSLQGWWAR